MTGNDKLGRVRTMVNDDGDTWDLSPKDKSALRHVLAMLDVAVSELSAKSGHRRNYMLQILHDAADRVEP